MPDYYLGPDYCHGAKYFLRSDQYQGANSYVRPNYFPGLDYNIEPNDDEKPHYKLQLYVDGMCVPSMETVPGSSSQCKQPRGDTGSQLDVLDAVAEVIRATRPDSRPVPLPSAAIIGPDGSAKPRARPVVKLPITAVDVHRPADERVDDHVEGPAEKYVDGYVDGYLARDANSYRGGSSSIEYSGQAHDADCSDYMESDPATSKGYETEVTEVTESTKSDSPIEPNPLISAEPDCPIEPNPLVSTEYDSLIKPIPLIHTEPDSSLEDVPVPLMIAKMRKMAERPKY